MRARAVAALLLILPVTVSGRARPLRWPLDEPRTLSSSFGEYRDGHYHAGVDLRTFGRVGLPCLAPDSCEAVRLRVSPAGYGKAVYVRFRDGTSAVFAHLSGFNRSLDSLAYAWRLERGRSSCDIEVPPGLARFRPGEIVAYSGSSGAPHPHLHFEMRDAAGRPFNPLVSRYDVPDGCAPILSGLEVVPLAWGSLANGSPLPATYRFRLERGDSYVLEDTLALDGIFGFGVSAFDTQVRGSYRMAPYSYELLIDGNPAYRLRNSGFDYSTAADVPLEYEDRVGRAPGRYLVLFKRPGNAMPDRDGPGAVTNDSARAGALDLADGPHEGVIVARDAAGNEARGRFRFVLGRAAAVEAPPAATRHGEPDSILCDVEPELQAEGLYLRITTDLPLASAPAVRRLDASGSDSLGVFPVGPREYEAFAPVERLASGANAFSVRGVDRRGRPVERLAAFQIFTFGTGGTASFEIAGGVAVRFTAPAVRGTAALMLRKAPPRAAGGPELASVGAPFALELASASYARPLRCDFDAGRGVGLFRWEGSAGWQCVGVPGADGSAVEVRRSGTYALFADSTAPVLRRFGYLAAARGSGFFKRKLCYVPVHEAGSGVDAESAAAYIDGERVVCEYDTFRSRLSIPIPRSRRGGPARLRVELADRAGNKAAAEFSCVIE
jgi:hypothetical protein